MKERVKLAVIQVFHREGGRGGRGGGGRDWREFFDYLWRDRGRRDEGGIAQVVARGNEEEMN